MFAARLIWCSHVPATADADSYGQALQPESCGFSMPVRTGRGQHLQRHVHSPVSHAPSHARPHYPCAFVKTYERTVTCCPACPRALWAAATGMGITVRSALRAQILATALLRRPRHYHQAAVSRARRGASRRAAVAVCSESAVSRQSVGGLSAICRRFVGDFQGNLIMVGRNRRYDTISLQGLHSHCCCNLAGLRVPRHIISGAPRRA